MFLETFIFSCCFEITDFLRLTLYVAKFPELQEVIFSGTLPEPEVDSGAKGISDHIVREAPREIN